MRYHATKDYVEQSLLPSAGQIYPVEEIVCKVDSFKTLEHLP